MTDDERLMALVRRALPLDSTSAPSRDLWPTIARPRQPVSWSWVDLGIAAAATAAFVWQPGWFVWLSYHF